MRRILTSVGLVVLLFPSLALGETVNLNDLVIRDGVFYKKSSQVPFTGKTMGNPQRTFRHGKIHGPYVEFWYDGRLSDKGTYKNGKREGPWVGYYENGQVWSEGDFKNGKEEGPWVDYHENGQLWFKRDYKNGKEEGPWVWYNKDGTVWEKYTGTYKDGKKVK